MALADVHETWACEDDYAGHYGRRRGWNRYYYDDYDEEDELEESPEPELIELIDGSVELRHWVEPGRPPAGMRKYVGGGELCRTKPSTDFEPFKSEHEGYMGNWGNTVDRWYHRAAVVLWPRERTFAIRAKASPAWALGEIGKKLRTKDVEAARQLAQRLLPFWSDVLRGDERPELLSKTLEVAVKLDAAEISTALLAPFTLTALKPKAASLLTDLLERHGSDWLRALLHQWTATKHYEPPDVRLAWIASGLPALCRALQRAKSAGDQSAGQDLARSVLAEQWTWTLDRVHALREQASPRERTRRASLLSKSMLALIDCSRITGDDDLHGQIIELLSADGADMPLELPLGVLRAAQRNHRTKALTELGLRPIHEHYARELATRLNAPAKGKDDWSITVSLRCTCVLCRTVGKYLRAPDKIRFDWPLAKEARARVHGIIDNHDLPVRHATRRVGRPFTLVLEKTTGVFEHAAAERRFWETELNWLTKTSEAF